MCGGVKSNALAAFRAHNQLVQPCQLVPAVGLVLLASLGSLGWRRRWRAAATDRLLADPAIGPPRRQLARSYRHGHAISAVDVGQVQRQGVTSSCNEIPDAKRLKELERENAWLKKLVAEQASEIDSPTAALHSTR